MIISNIDFHSYMGRVIAGPLSDFAPGSVTKVVVDGRDIAVVNVDGTCYAIDDTCTHAGASLSEGTVSGCNVVCGWHGAQFDCATGRLAKFPATIRDLASYPVSIEDGSLYVEVS